MVYALADTLRDEKGKTEDDTLCEMDLRHWSRRQLIR